MAFRIIVKPIVWFDLEEAITWYQSERSGLGKQFFNSFEEVKEKIKANPKVYLNIIPGLKEF